MRLAPALWSDLLLDTFIHASPAQSDLGRKRSVYFCFVRTSSIIRVTPSGEHRHPAGNDIQHSATLKKAKTRACFSETASS
ncbi:hypothetical protein BDW59DRAFT_140024 [Aspergillus cavernicola]|uniref:Secreted protein n=1 Tax=Aspergillus cavernicola TaxID=176166 RepID=A0ABR4IVI7_9EURO